jgi:hypothetical protein
MNAQTLTRFEESNWQEPELIDVDMPFDIREVEQATSKRFVEQLTRSDMPIVAAGTDRSLHSRNLRAEIQTDHVFDPIDVDMPFSAAEVAALTSEMYVVTIGRSDMPVAGLWR